MPLIYAFVARSNAGNPVVLSEYSLAGKGSNVSKIALECMQHVVASSETKMTVTCDKHTFNFLKADPYVFVAVADEVFGRQVPYAYLDRVSEAWGTSFASKAELGAAHSFDRSFGPRLREYMEYLNNNPESINKMVNIQKQVAEIKSVMVENIEKVVLRGEKLQLLVEQTEDLQESAKMFQKQGRQLRTQFWWANAKAKAAFAGIILLICIIIVLIACFSGGNRCVPKKQG